MSRSSLDKNDQTPSVLCSKEESSGRKEEVGGPGELEHDGGTLQRSHPATGNPVCFLLTRRCREPGRPEIVCTANGAPRPQGNRQGPSGPARPLPSATPRASFCDALKKYSAVLCPCYAEGPLQVVHSWGPRPHPMAKLATNSRGPRAPTEHPCTPSTARKGAGARALTFSWYSLCSQAEHWSSSSGTCSRGIRLQGRGRAGPAPRP